MVITYLSCVQERRVAIGSRAADALDQGSDPALSITRTIDEEVPPVCDGPFLCLKKKSSKIKHFSFLGGGGGVGGGERGRAKNRKIKYRLFERENGETGLTKLKV